MCQLAAQLDVVVSSLISWLLFTMMSVGIWGTAQVEGLSSLTGLNHSDVQSRV